MLGVGDEIKLSGVAYRASLFWGLRDRASGCGGTGLPV